MMAVDTEWEQQTSAIIDRMQAQIDSLKGDNEKTPAIGTSSTIDRGHCACNCHRNDSFRPRSTVKEGE